MKTRLITLAIVAASVATFAQGKVNLGNDSGRRFVFNPTSMLSADVAYDGQHIPNSPLPSGNTLYLALYAGTAAPSLSLQTTYPLTAANMLSAGRIANKAVTLTGVAGGLAAFFQIYLWSSYSADIVPPTVTGGSDLRLYGTINPFYYGSTGLFSAVPGTSIIYPDLYQTTAPVNSTWLPGDVMIYGAPEPSSVALVGLGMGLMLLRRRRCG